VENWTTYLAAIAIINNIITAVFGPTCKLEHFPPNDNFEGSYQYDGGVDGVVVYVSYPFINGNSCPSCHVNIEPGNLKRVPDTIYESYTGPLTEWNHDEWVACFTRSLTYFKRTS